MNKTTLIRNIVTLSCKHKVLYDVRPRLHSIVFCIRCGNGRHVRQIVKG